MRRRMVLLHRCERIDLTFLKSTKILIRKYDVQLRHSKNNAGQEAVKEMTAEKRGYPFLLGKLDGMVQTYIRSALNHGAVFTRSMVVATAKALMIRYPDIVRKINLDFSSSDC